jgi:hypothetical protein
MGTQKLWKTGHKQEETPIKDGDSCAGKGKDAAKKRPEAAKRNDF